MRHHQLHRALLAQTISACLLGLPGSLRGQDAPPLQLASPIGSAVGKTSKSPEARFVVGRLERVRRGDSGTTRFALIDEQGQVAAFVAPTTRFDLRSMLGSEIGVQATTFTEADHAPPYLIADNVMRMHGSDARVAGGENLISDPAQLRVGRVVPASAAMAAPSQRSGLSPAPTPAEPRPPQPRVANNGGPWEVLPADTPIPMGAASESRYVPDGQDFTGVCGPVCELPCTTCVPGPPTCGPPGWLWVRGEYLAWWSDGMDLPPLVTTSPENTPIEEAGVLGASGTSILFGGDSVLDDEARSGYRIRFGGWFGPCRRIGYEGEYLELDNISEFFTASCNGTGLPIISRPIFNINPGGGAVPGQAAELVCYPGEVFGTVTVAVDSELRSAAGRVRWNVCCKQSCDRCGSCDPCGCRRCGYAPYMKVDLIAGYRWAGLNESVRITEDLTTLNLDPLPEQRFEIADSFRTENDFNGAELGVACVAGRNRWTLESFLNVAIGNVRQQVTIDGSTTISRLGPPFDADTFDAGILALATNIGDYRRDEFAMIPQLGTNVGLYVTPRLRAIVGYTLFYWSRVARPGDQIDLDVNPEFIEPDGNGTGPLRPAFVFRDTDLWLQGLNVGLDYTW